MAQKLVTAGQITLVDLNDAIISGTEPVNPTLGTLWIKNSVTPSELYRWNGNAWALQTLSLAGLDPDQNDKIEESETTLRNLALDGVITRQERSYNKDKVASIIGYAPGDTASMPTTAVLDSSNKGDVYAARREALNAGILSTDAKYVAVATNYTNLANYLNGMTPKPWDTTSDNLNTIDFNTWVGKWQAYYQSILDLKNAVAAKLKQNADDVEIGGTNLMDNSSADIDADGNNQADNWSLFQGMTGLVRDTGRTKGYSLKAISNGTAGAAFKTPSVDIVAGQTYTHSVWMKRSDDGTIASLLKFRDANNAESNPVPSISVTAKAGEWTYFSQTFTAPSTAVSVYATPRMDTSANGTILWVDDVKLERGNRATDWTPSVADVQYGIDKALADAAKVRTDLNLTSSLPTTIAMNSDGITAATSSDPNAYARLDYRGLYIKGGAIQIDGGLDPSQMNLTIGGRNLFIKNTMTANTYVNDAGTAVANPGSFISDFIAVKPGSYITFTNGKESLHRIGQYNGSKTWLRRVLEQTKGVYTWKVPADCYYIKYSADNYADGLFKVEEGNIGTTWALAPEDTDIENGVNKWLFRKYNFATGSNAIPSYTDIQDKTMDAQDLVSDGATIVSGVADSYIGSIRTGLYVNQSKTIAFTFTHDEGCQIYVNGKSQYSKGGYTVGASATLTLNKGWNTVEILWSETTSGDGIFSVSPVISKLVDKMSAAFGDDSGRITNVAATSLQSGAFYNGIKIDTTSGFVATRSDNKVKTTINATEGIKIENSVNGGSSWNKVLYADTNGVLHAKGLVIDTGSTLGGVETDTVVSRIGDTEQLVGLGKWIARKYPLKLASATTNPTQADIAEITPTELKEIADAMTLDSFSGTYFIQEISTYAYVSAAKTVNLTFTSTTGKTIYLNDTKVKEGAGAQATALSLAAGWNKIEILLYEHDVNATLTVNAQLSNSVDKMTNVLVSMIDTELKEARTSFIVEQGRIDSTVSGLRDDFQGSNTANLLHGSDFSSIDSAAWTTSTSWGSLDSTFKYQGKNTAKIESAGLTADSWRGLKSVAIPVNEGETYTASVWTYTDDLTTFDGNATLEIDYYAADNSRVNGRPIAQIKPTKIKEWQKSVVTFTIPATVTRMHFYMYNVRNGRFWASMPQIQIGKVATTWTPHIDELATGLQSQITQTSGKVSVVVSDSNQVKGDVLVSSINLQPGTVKIASKMLDITGLVTFSSFDSTMKNTITNDGNIINNNPYFIDWSGTYPTGIVSQTMTSGSSAVKVATDTTQRGNVIKFTVGNTTAANAYYTPALVSNYSFTQYVTLQVTFKLESGTIDGAGVLLRLSGTANNDYRLHLKDIMASPTLNQWYTITKVIKVTSPAGFNGYQVFPMGGWGGFTTNPTQKVFHMSELIARPSTEQEINAYETGNTVTQNSSTWGRASNINADGTFNTSKLNGQINPSQLTSTSPNILYDVDSFEQYANQVPPGSSGSVSTCIVSDEEAYHGRYSLKTENSASNSYKYLNPSRSTSSAGWIKLGLGRYILSAYAKTTSTTDVTVSLNSVPRQGATTTATTAGVSVNNPQYTLKDTDGWVRVVSTVNVTDLAQVPYLTFYVRTVTAQASTVYWDAIQLEFVGSQTHSNPSPFSPGGTSTINSSSLSGAIDEGLLTNSSKWNDAKAKVDLWKYSSDVTKINGGTIATSTIFAQQMALGDFTNLVQINEQTNTIGYPTTIVANDPHFKIGNAGYAPIKFATAKQVEFKVGDEYYYSFIGFKDASMVSANFIIRYYYSDNTWLNAGISSVPILTTGGFVEGVVKITTAPESGKTVSRVDWFIEKDSVTNGYYYLRNLELRKRYGGSLIVDGSIQAKHIQANSITANEIKGGTLTIGSLDQATQDKISTGVQASTDLNNLGIRNLIINSTANAKFDIGWNSLSSLYQAITPEPDKPTSSVIKISRTGLSADSIASAYSNWWTASNGDTFTISFDMKVKSFAAYDITKPFIMEFHDAAGNRVQYKDVALSDMNASTLPDNQWVRLTYTTTGTVSSITRARIRLSLFRNGEVYYREIKAERGNRATPWIPAPEDTEYKIANMIVGGRNLIQDSLSFNVNGIAGTASITKNNQSAPDGTSTAHTLTTTTVASNFRFSNVVPENGEYIFSVYLKSSTTGNVDITMDICDKGSTSITVTPTWQRFSVTTKVDNWTASTYHFADIYLPANASIYAWHPQLEVGNVATAWAISPEDAALNLANAEARAKNYLGDSAVVNPNFIDWSGIYPVGMGYWNGTATKETTLTRNNGAGALRFNVTADTSQAGVSVYSSFFNPSLPNNKYYLVELDFMLVSGSIIGAGLIVDWIGMTNYRSTVKISDYIASPTLNKWHTIRAVVKRPTDDATDVAKFTNMYGFLVANWTSFGNKIKDIVFGRYNIRVASEEEAKSYENDLLIKQNKDTWALSSNFRSDGTLDPSKLYGTIADTKISSSSSWNSAASLTNTWKSGTTQINGGVIATNTILAQSMLMGDFTNLCENGDFELDTTGSTARGWNSSSQGRVADISQFTNGNGSGKALEIDASSTGNADQYVSSIIPVTPGQKFFVEAEARYLNTAGGGYGRIGFRRWSEKRVVMNNWDSVIWWSGGSTKEQSFTKKNGVYTVPAGCNYIQIWASFLNNGETTNKFYLDNIRVHRMGTAELIVDGAILANHIEAGQIQTSHIKAEGLDAKVITTGTMSVGSAQLIPGTAWGVTGVPYSLSSGLSSSVVTDGGEDYLALAQTGSTELFGYLKRFPLVGGKTVTLAVEIGYDSNVKAPRPDIFILASKGVYSTANAATTGFDYVYNMSSSEGASDSETDIGGGWTRFTRKFTLANDVKSAYIRLDHNGSTDGAKATIRIRSLMLNYGTIAMEWQPHTDESLSYGILEAKHIKANSITITELDNATTNKLSKLAADGKLSTSNLTGTVSDSQVASSSAWNTSKNLTSGWVTNSTEINGGKIATSSITAKSMVLSDFSNLCENPDFETDTVGQDPRGWFQNSGTKYSRVADTSAFGANGNGSNKAYELDARNGGNSDVFTELYIPVKQGQTFYVEGEGRYLNTAGTGYAFIGFREYDAKKAHVNWNLSATWEGTKPTSYVKKSGVYTVPSGVAYIVFRASFLDNKETTNKFYLDNLRVHRMANAELIVDGAVQTNHMTTNTIDAKVLKASTITAEKVAIGNFENLFQNGTFELGDTGWESSNQFWVQTGSTSFGNSNWYLRIPHNGGYNDVFDTKPIKVQPGDKYYLEGYFRIGTGTISNARTFIINQKDKDGNKTNWIKTESLNITYTKFSYVYTVPDTTTEIRIGCSVDGAHNSGTNTYVGQVLAKRMVTGELIVDGTVEAKHIKANSITITEIDTPTTTKINNGNQAKTDIDNLEIGGSNLIDNTMFLNGTTGWKAWQSNTITTYGVYGTASKQKGIRVYSSTATTAGIAVETPTFSMMANKTYTVSFIYRSYNSAPGILNYLYLRQDQSSSVKGLTAVDASDFPVLDTADNNSRRVSFQVSHTSSIPNASIMIGFAGTSVADQGFGMREIMIEQAKKPSWWSPSPNEVGSRIGDIEGTVTTSNVSKWNLAGNFRSDGTLDPSKIYGSIPSNKVSGYTDWNDAKAKVDLWKSGTTQINGGVIATGTIFAQSMLMGDFTNLCENPDFEQDTVGQIPAGFNSTSGVRVADISAFQQGNGSAKALEFDCYSTSNNSIYASSLIPVTPGQSFFYEAEGRYLNTAGTGTFRIGFRRYDAKRNAADLWDGVIYWNGTKNTEFTTKNGTYKVPSNCYYLQIYMSFATNGETTNKFYIDNIRLHRMQTAELIVDGAITANHVNAGALTWDKASGGTITLGGTGNVNGELVVNDADGDVVVELNTLEDDGLTYSSGFQKLNAQTLFASDSVKAPNVVEQTVADISYYIDPIGGDDTNVGDGWASPLATIQAAVDRVPKFLNHAVTIQVHYNNGKEMYEDVVITGFSGQGNIKLDFQNNSNTLYGSISYYYNNAPFSINEGTFIANKDQVPIYVVGTTLFRADGLIVNSKALTSYCYYISNSYADIRGCEGYNATNSIVLSGYGSRCDVVDMKGAYAPYGLRSYRSSIIAGTGTAPVGQTANQSESEGGIVQGNWTYPAATPPATSAPKTYKTVTVTSTSLNSWRANYSSWYNKSRVVQGKWGSYGRYYGYWFFGSLFDQFNGKTITKVRIYASRYNGGGSSSSQTARFTLHGYTSQPSSSSTPSYVGSYAATAGFKWGEAKWIDVTSAFKGGINQSTVKGIGLYVAADSPYMIFTGNLKVEVTYQV